MFEDKCMKNKTNCKVRDHCYYRTEYREGARRIYNIKYGVTKEISVVVHNVSNYDYHFINCYNKITSRKL